METLFDRVFLLRLAIARLGEQDALGWWASSALGKQGRFVLARIFRRAPDLAAAHVAILAAGAAHHALLPEEPLVHLFNLGETFEGGFERWLIAAKSRGAAIPQLPEIVSSEGSPSGGYLKALGLEIPDSASGTGAIPIGESTMAALDRDGGRQRAAERLAAAYAHSKKREFRPPYLRLRG